ncbi:maleylacetoacetate isomerase [Formosimonas limnophila]|uniref:Maleylacetoacetate isomerase n=1 Tax=Formosimonas limnophila TaxID=1384487 RepID=A0A8J3CFD5_9BURK|nr:maleylacetoacetate isomerase [Formosimonas limnophila]GHA63794.1 maleylacetoacetate isomerase [Formosimonas limnophila]
MRTLYDYFRSSAAYRVRIALALKNLPYEREHVLLLENMQNSQTYKAHNPQGLVPALEEDGVTLTQSLAICEYLDEVYLEPALLPVDALGRAQVRAMALSIACDIHPLNNMRVLRYLTQTFDVTADEKDDWYRHWIDVGFAAFESHLSRTAGLYCWGDTVSLADVCLVPQVYNARRFQYDMTRYPRIAAITEQCLSLPAFHLTSPEQVSS